MVGSREDAEDLTQEIFVKLHRSIRKFKWKSRFSTWFYALAANTCRSGIRRLRRISEHEVARLVEGDPEGRDSRVREPVDSAMGPGDKVAGREVRAKVEAAIESLGDDFRMVIVLRDLQGLSYDEISRVVGCSIGTVKSRLARARMKVKDSLLREDVRLTG
jgi:RNA polymerase sigma-70 factor (ECF subfamily)